MTGVLGILALALLAPAARAQGRVVIVQYPVITTIRLQTTVLVPDGGTVTLGGYSSYSENRSEFGAPILGKLPYAGRGFRTTTYGRDVSSTRVTVGARIIDIYEEEFRQTGVRSR
jgi:type II secretory pathway component HofQ